MANTSTLSEHHAGVTLPDTIAPGEYIVSVSNGLGGEAGWSNMSFFESPDRPRVISIFAVHLVHDMRIIAWSSLSTCTRRLSLFLQRVLHTRCNGILMLNMAMLHMLADRYRSPQ